MQTIESIIENTVRRVMNEVLAEHKPSPVVEGPPALTVKQAAKIVGCSDATMYQIIHRADFDAAIRVGRSIKVLRHKLLAWMERQADGEVTA